MTHPAQRGGYPDDLMTVAEVASILRVSKMTVYRLVQVGQLSSLRIGRSFRLRRADVAEYLHRSQLGGPEEQPIHHSPHNAEDVHATHWPTAAPGTLDDAADPPARTSLRVPHNADPANAQRRAPQAESSPRTGSTQNTPSAGRGCC